MMMMNRKSIATFLFLFTAGIACSQESDFGVWLGVSAQHELIKKLDVELSGCMRSFNNASQIEQSFLEGGLQYKFNRYLSASGSYRLIYTLEKDSEYHIRNKWFLDLKGTLPYHNFYLSARFRFQQTTRTYFENEEDKLSKSYARVKFTAGYNTPSSPINPYLAYESFSPMFADAGFQISKYRLSPGIEIKLTRASSIELEYIFQREHKKKTWDEHIISLNYDIRF